MHWWMWALAAVALIVLVVLTTDRVLREADVVDWGASGQMQNRVEALEDRIVELEHSAADAENEPPSGQFIVVNRYSQQYGLDTRLCIDYAAPGGSQTRCFTVYFDDEGELTKSSQASGSCFSSAVIGEPLPACWR